MPFDRPLDRLGIVAKDDHHLGKSLGIDRVEHMLQDRPATELGEQLHAAEPRRGTGGENDRADRHGFGRLGHPPVIGVGSRISRT